MDTTLLTRRPHEGVPPQTLIGSLTLTRARAHEGCGPARRTLAALLAGQTEGPVFWVLPQWSQDAPHGPGLTRFVNPGRITFVRARTALDLLWCTEEVLRSGAAPLVITELPDAPPITPVRRLHLAAEQGIETGRAPIALLLTPGHGGAQGVESRWSLTPTHHVAPRSWRLARLRDRALPPREWMVQDTGAAFDLTDAAHSQDP